MATDEESVPATAKEGIDLIRSLAACSASTRSKTLKALISWLQQQQQPEPTLSDDDLKKLWKGLFYCVWHCDKTVNQANLINRLAALLVSLSPPLSVLYFSHFLLTLRREWSGIDRLRLDKFYLMVRVFIGKLFELLSKKKWRLDVVEQYWGVLEERLLDCQGNEKGLGDGVAYHVVSIFCEEIKPYLPLRLEVLNLLFRPFVSVLGRSANKVLTGKLKSDVFGYLVKSGRGLLQVKQSGEEVDSNDERVLFGTIALAMEFSFRFYELGSSPDCVQGNRKLLFALHEEFLKLEKDMKAAEIDVKLPEADGDDNEDDEIPQLIPVSDNGNAGEAADPSDKPKKKSKKKKDKEGSKDKENKKKRKKKKKKITENGVDKSLENETVDMTIDANEEPDSSNLSDSALSNLQKQFEVIAAEAGLAQGVTSSLESLTVQENGEVTKKRKRGKKKKEKANGKISPDPNVEDDSGTTAEKSTKKVKFSMKHNLVWNPSNPLPPQSIRIPPSVTPRGSALKAGVPPGPVREFSSSGKRAKKKASPLKKKAGKGKSPVIKRMKKLKAMSA